MKEFAEQVAAKLRAEIPGLETHVRYSIEQDMLLLHGRYACPCGESSQFVEHFYGDVPRSGSVYWYAERLKHMLREHVRGEGNEPNF